MERIVKRIVVLAVAFAFCVCNFFVSSAVSSIMLHIIGKEWILLDSRRWI